MSQTSGFDLSKMSTASKILMGGGIAYLIVLFLPWQRGCAEVAGFEGVCVNVGGTAGIGILNLLLVIGLLAWEGMALANVNIQAPRALISAALAGAIVVFTLLKILIDSESLYLFAFLGVLLALVIGYGGWMRWQEHQAGAGGGGTPPPPPASTTGGGFTG